MAETPMLPLAASTVENASDPYLEMWLHGKSPHTQRNYRREATLFLAWVKKPLEQVTLADVQGYANYLAEGGRLAVASQARAIAAVKSLLSFGHQLGLLRVNAARPVRLPKFQDKRSERILDEATVQLLIRQEPNLRNRMLLKLLYLSGVRVSELVQLTWRCLQPVGKAGQVTVFGKGGKTRAVKLPESLWRELQALRGDADGDAPVFASRKGQQHLSPVQVNRIVKAAIQRVPDLDPQTAARVSPHWLRHAHASHAIDRGAPLHLVQATLGHASIATTGRYLHARPTESSGDYLPSL